MISVRKVALAAALALSAGGVSAAYADPEVHGRFENQMDRIREGYANGSLNHDEACRLVHQERQLRHERQHEAKNGLSDNERAGLNRKLDRESERIHADRTNDHDADHKGRHL